MRKTVFVILAMAVAPLCVFAVDGVVLINQSTALAGGVTPGDLPGFPVSITQPGSYRLTGNLNAPAGVNGIEISASNVTLDLNGFSIGCGGGSVRVNCIASFSGFFNISIRNGVINQNAPTSGQICQFPGCFTGISMQFSERIFLQNLFVDYTDQSATGISVGRGSVLRNNVIRLGYFSITCPSIAVENVWKGADSVNLAPCVDSNNVAVP